jgi:hypothetical protein
MQDINEYINNLSRFDFTQTLYNGAQLPLPVFIHHVGIVVVARDSFPGMSIQESMAKLIEQFQPSSRPVGDETPPCGTCGGGNEL